MLGKIIKWERRAREKRGSIDFHPYHIKALMKRTGKAILDFRDCLSCQFLTFQGILPRVPWEALLSLPPLVEGREPLSSLSGLCPKIDESFMYIVQIARREGNGEI